MDIYAESRKLQEASDYRMTTKVQVNVYPLNSDRDVDINESDVEITWDMEPEYRSWGMKGIDVTLRDTVTVLYTENIYTDDDEESVDKEIEIDLSSIDHKNINWTPGSHVLPTALTVYLNEDGSVNYEKTSIDFDYWTP